MSIKFQGEISFHHNEEFSGMHLRMTIYGLPEGFKHLVSECFTKGIISAASGMGPRAEHDNISFLSKGVLSVNRSSSPSFEENEQASLSSNLADLKEEK